MPSGRKKAKSQEFWTEEEVMDFGLGVDEGHFESGQREGQMTLAADHPLFGSPVSQDGASLGTTPASEITKSGRMRKKTAKLIEMEEVDKLEKIPRKAEVTKTKKQKPTKATSDRLTPKTSSSAPIVDSSNFSEDSGDLAPLVIANVFSLSSSDRSDLDPLRLSSAIETTAGSKSTKSAKAKKQKAAAVLSENFGAVFGSSELEQHSRAAVLGSGVASEQIVVSTPQFSDVSITASTKKHSKKKSNMVPPPFTIKLENPPMEPSLMQAGRNTSEMSLSLASSYPEVLPHLQSPVSVKEELDHIGSTKEEGIIVTVRKEKSKKKHKSAMDLTESTDECQLLNLMPETQAKKKKRLVIGQQLPNPRKDAEKPKKKRQKGYTAYMLWCSVQRAKVVAQNPGIDFAQISKRLGDMWQTVPEKEKMTWRRKARRMTKKGSSLIKTGLNVKDEMSMAEVGHRKMLYNTKPLKIKKIVEDPVSKVTSIDHIDVAAHFKLLGESLTTIGARLQEHGGHIAVQGSLSVLLDSLLCTLGPLMSVTNQVPQINGTPEEVHRSTLENIAYIMPGVG